MLRSWPFCVAQRHVDGDGDGGHDGDGDVGQEDDSNAGLIWVRDAAIVSRKLFAIAPTSRGPGPYSGL